MPWLRQRDVRKKVKMRKSLLFLFFLIPQLLCHPAMAGDDGQGIPETVTIGHWSCRDVAELAKKYGATKRLPDSVVVGGKTCSRDKLARCLLSVLESVCARCDYEGCQALTDDDREKIARLHDALKAELSRYQGYQEIRETIERLLARPEMPPFVIRAGIGGFLRGEGAESFRLPDLSYDPGHSEGRFLYRIKPYVYWHPTDYLDIHVEAQGYGFDGSSRHSGRFNLYQGFVEARPPGSGLLALKLGRQEFTYGSTFILGSNSFFDGLVFDSARLRVKPSDGLSVDLLGGYYGTAFNNRLSGDIEGMYATYAFSGADALEGYFFRDTGHEASTPRRPGEQLLICGLRGTAGIGPLSVELEPVLESGEVFNPATSRNDDVSAYGGHIDLTAGADIIGFHNKFVSSMAFGSGSPGAAAGTDLGGEFRNPDNDTYLVGDMHVIGDLSGVSIAGHHASGIQDYTLGWGIVVMDDLNFSATGHYFLANDAPRGISRRIGLETDFTLSYTINKDMSLIVGYDRFFTGGFFRGASGRGDDIGYGYAMLNFDFNVARLKRPRT